MRLPKVTKKAQDVRLTDLAYFFYGPPGIGKTVLVSGFVNTRGAKVTARPLFLHTSPVKYVEAYKIAISGWSPFKEAVRQLERDKPRQYSHIAVDIIDHIWQHCREEVAERHGFEHEGDLPHGKGWDLVKKEFIPTIAKLCTLGYGVSFVSHSKTIETRGRLVTTKKIVPTLQAGGLNLVLPICDIQGFLGFSADDADADSGVRRIFFEPTETVDAKDWTDRLPQSIKTHRDPTKTVAEITAYLTGEKVARGREGGRAKRKKKVAARRKARRVVKRRPQ